MEARVYFFPDPEPEPMPRLEAELNAEVGRLIAGKPGESELEFIYKNNPGPVARKWAIWDLAAKRIKRSMQPNFKGVVNVSIHAKPDAVDIEIQYGKTDAQLKFGPVAQRTILLPIINSERPKEQAPTGEPSGKGTLKLTQALPPEPRHAAPQSKAVPQTPAAAARTDQRSSDAPAFHASNPRPSPKANLQQQAKRPEPPRRRT